MRVFRSEKKKLNTHSFSFKLFVSANISSTLRQKLWNFVKLFPFSSLTYMDRLAGCNYYLDAKFTNLLQITKRRKRFFETWHEFFAQPAAAKLKIKATISCFLQTCAHKLDEEQRSTNCTCWIFYALVQSKKNTITCHSTIITRKTSLNKEDWTRTPFCFSLFFWTWIIQCPKARIALQYNLLPVKAVSDTLKTIWFILLNKNDCSLKTNKRELKAWFPYRCICRICRTKKIHRTDRIHSISYNKLYPSFLLYWAFVREISIKLYLSY